MSDIDLSWPWRTGRSIHRTIYACPPGSRPRDGEIVIGMMDTPELAAAVVEAHNIVRYLREDAVGAEELRTLIERHKSNPDDCNRQWSGYAICRLERGHEGRHESGYGQWWTIEIGGSSDDAQQG